MPGALADYTLGLNLGSVHLNHVLQREQRYNDVNPGVYARKGDWQAGIYHNSYHKPSVYAARAFPLGHGVEGALGLVTGYKYPITPVPMLSYKLNDLLRLSLMPGGEKGTLGALHLSAEF